MKLLGLAFLLLLSSPADAQTLSGGGFEMRKHGVGPVSQGDFAVAGGSMTFAGGVRALAASSYPLSEPGGMCLNPTPGGPLLYLNALSNFISLNAFSVSVLPDSVPEAFEFFINDPMVSPLRVNPASITAATARLSQTQGAQASLVPQSVVEFNLLGESNAFYTANLAHPVTISLPYTDANNDGIVDGSNPPVRAKNLGIYVLDEMNSLWVRMPGATVDAAGHTVTGITPHFSVYALVGNSDNVVDDVHPFPVPWAPNSGNTLDGTLAGGITFTNLPSEGTVSIYTPSGQLVRSLPIPSFAAQVRWDVKTPSGQDVVSGVYLWRVQSGRNSKVGKLMVIR